MDNHKKRVGFFFPNELNHWNGGINYFRNLITILINSDDYVPVIICSDELTNLVENRFPDVEVHFTKYMKDGTLISSIRKFILYTLKYNLFVNKILRDYKIDIVSHDEIFPPNKNTKISTSCWIPDFQSMHFPELFSKKNEKRVKILRKILFTNCDKIIVSSEDCKNDLVTFYPYVNKDKIVSFPFALPPKINDDDYDIHILNKYGLVEKKYFLITNQFWEHKNHKTVLKAIEYLIESNKNIDFKIVATGLLKDLRNPSYGEELKEIIQSFSNKDVFVTTGNIPYTDVKTLINYSIAIIQPSLFEGWNTSVEECKLIGKKIILSDLPVHREQNPENVVFFNPKDYKELGDILLRVYDNYNIDEEDRYENSAKDHQIQNWKNFSERYLKILGK